MAGSGGGGGAAGLLISIAVLACLELDRTEVPQTMQNDALVSSTFSPLLVTGSSCS